MGGRLLITWPKAGPTASILKRIAHRGDSTQIRVLGLLVIVGLAAAGAWLIRSPAAADFLCRWPQAFGILFGIAYWAWLWPSWLGIVDRRRKSVVGPTIQLAGPLAAPGSQHRPPLDAVAMTHFANALAVVRPGSRRRIVRPAP